jgi:hypothetical protein
MELQNALIIAGVVLLLLLVAYNRWQIYKARRVRPLMPEDDVQPMREPVVGKTTHPETAASSRRPRRPEHVSRREPTLVGADSVPPNDEDRTWPRWRRQPRGSQHRGCRRGGGRRGCCSRLASGGACR